MDLECTAGITKIAIKASEDDGIVSRVVRMTLTREFDGLIAAAIGGDAPKLRESLRSHAASKVEIPIDAIAGECLLQGEMGDEVKIKLVQGVKATGKAPKAEDENPSVELVFDFGFQLAAWDFFGKNVGSRAVMKFTQAQTEIDFPPPPANGTKAHASEGKTVAAIAARLKAAVPEGATMSVIVGGKKTVLVDKRSPAEIAADDEQSAATPEEAEALRETRLAAEKGPEPTYSAAVRARMEAHMEDAKLTKHDAGDEVYWSARFETPTRIFDVNGGTKAIATRTLRDHMLAVYAEEEAKLVSGGGLKNGGLKVPTNGAAKVRRTTAEAQPAAPDEDDLGPVCSPACSVDHVHNLPVEGGDLAF